jgi:hypothetical protein
MDYLFFFFFFFSFCDTNSTSCNTSCAKQNCRDAVDFCELLQDDLAGDTAHNGAPERSVEWRHPPTESFALRWRSGSRNAIETRAIPHRSCFADHDRHLREAAQYR